MMDFMDSLRRGVDRAGYELDRLLRTNRVRSQINGLRSRMDEEIRQIGESVMELYRRGEPLHEELRQRCERVTEYEAGIRGMEAELAAIEQETAATVFRETQEPEPSESLNCARCGTTLPADAAFCLKCGARLSPEEQTEPESETARQSEVGPEQPGAPGATDEPAPPEAPGPPL